MGSEASPGPRSLLIRMGAYLLACAVVLVLVEGLSSLFLLVSELRDGSGEEPVAERRHTRYDAELGWANVPGFDDSGFYGPRRALTINAQGFRGRRDVSPQPSAGKARVVCSGDSFTLGYGVADQDSWCARLEVHLPQIEAVNMGQGGYGLGQAFLWYRRDGAHLGPRVHLFAFITADFGRMLADSFLGYGKPVLRVRDGRLVTENVPVPRSSYLAPWLVAHREAFASLRSVALLRRLLGRVAAPAEIDPAQLRRVAAGIFAELARLDREQGTELILVYLPMRHEVAAGADPRIARLVADAAREHALPLVDLGEEVRRLPRERLAGLYLAPGEVSYPGATGHLSADGNDWVARRLMPHVTAALARRGAAHEEGGG